MIKFLVVDDETGVVEQVKELFEMRNYAVVTATSGEKALELVKKENPNIILSHFLAPAPGFPRSCSSSGLIRNVV